MNIPNEWVTGILGGGGLSAVLTYLAGRGHGRAEFINAVSAAADKVINRLQAECDRITRRCNELESQHEQCSHDLGELRRKITEMMGDPVPPYTLGPAE